MSPISQRKGRLSQTIQTIPPSGIRRFFELASSMEGVISLGVGEPDFVTPWGVREAAINSLERGYTSYTSNSGLYELREEICQYLASSFQAVYEPAKEILVTVGASEGIDLALRAILDPGDEVLVVEPCYVSYDPVIRLAGGVPVPVETELEQNFKVTPQQLEAKITDRTKAIIFCFPNNPTGSIMTREELAGIASVIEKHDLIAISDEIYAELTYDTRHSSFAALPGMKDRTLLLSGFSKAFAMTGWRLGYAAGPEDIIAAMTKIHQYTMLCAPITAQIAALEALRSGMEAKDRMVESYRQRRNYIVKAFEQIGLACHKPEGAFYAFPQIDATGMSADEFAEQLILEQKVAVVPGHVFGPGCTGHIRCSYATSMENLEMAIERIDAFLQNRK
ncbi:aminotransferase [Aneurinibacillus sp. Ricciae_BoGa-3]|uniref:aminotransferase n=1 Tax=Aneurinibacillus sp. Ricciae_BoGa-3 TaxID=3022697 RepID=UPI0023412617|nr:aminotransferase [Aneurinibacillus sp. Ricciae_BoGa-3]WCK54309.1 aminotransferase [Aneurinibacillus sp. Ricciae_BoGa-3]